MSHRFRKKRELTQSDSVKQVQTHTDSTLALVESGTCCGEVRTLLGLSSSSVRSNGASTGAASQCAASTWDVDSKRLREQPEVHLHFSCRVPHTTQVQQCGGLCQQAL